MARVPIDKSDNTSSEIIQQRLDFMESVAGKSFTHIRHHSISPEQTRGNIENFTGVCQIPLGIAGPLQVNGEHAQGDFLIPLATTEGTLVASYNRGIKVLNLCGGVDVAVVAESMQRAPVFAFGSARRARDFAAWVLTNMDTIRQVAESTTRIGKLIGIDPYLTNRYVYLRFNYTTGDAAGQNMVSKATFAACHWILDQIDDVEHFYLEANFATDKKASQVNMMRTRGRRVTAEITVPKDILLEHLRVTPQQIDTHHRASSTGAYMSGANNNGAHSANAIAAMFIATGQDAANVAESSAGILHVELTPTGDLHMSLTIPSLIVATYGGGTNLPTQRECLELMDCHGEGKVRKLAEIIGGVALAGELSLAAAISSEDWVSSHEAYGRNR